MISQSSLLYVPNRADYQGRLGQWGCVEEARAGGHLPATWKSPLARP